MTLGIRPIAGHPSGSAPTAVALVERAPIDTYRPHRRMETVPGTNVAEASAALRRATSVSRAVGGVLAVGVGLALGGLGGGIIGLAIGVLMVAGPDIRLLMALGGAGEGALGGILIGGLVAVLRPGMDW